jgi:putrescine transport system permease protein
MMENILDYLKKINLRYLLVGQPFLWLFIFFLLPFFILIVISLSPVTESVPPFSPFIYLLAEEGALVIKPYLDNFQILFHDAIYRNAYLDSVRIAAISTIFAVIIAYPIAYGIAKAEYHRQNLLLLLVVIPFWTSLLIRIYSWIILLRDNGIINQCLMYFGIISEPIIMMNTEFAVILGIVYSYLPFMILPLYSSLQKIDPILLEAAEDLGCKPFSAFWRVTFPLSLPGLIAGCLLVFIPAIGEFVIPDLLGGSSVITIGKVIWTEFFINRDWPMAAAATIAITGLLVVPIAIMQKILGQKNDDE